MPPFGSRLSGAAARCAGGAGSASRGGASMIAKRARPAGGSAGVGPAMRAFASTKLARSTTNSNASDLPPLPPPRWLADLRARVGKCIIFGCSPAQVADAAVVLRALATEWRPLVAGSEGFLTGTGRGLEGHKVAWGEMDSFGHVNNVVYARYAEAARVNWIHHFARHVDPARARQWRELMMPRTVGLIMKSLTTEFKFPMTYPDAISVYHRLRASPEADPAATSLLLDCVVLSHSHRRAAARLYEDVAIYDYRIGAKTQMPDFMREVLTDVWRQQQAETARARARIGQLAAAVARLEKQTWDRADAVEDVGSAAA